MKLHYRCDIEVPKSVSQNKALLNLFGQLYYKAKILYSYIFFKYYLDSSH